MMKQLRKMLNNYLVMSGFCALLGLAIIIRPALLTKALAYVVGGLLVGYGIVRIAVYMKEHGPAGAFGIAMIGDIILIIAGAFIMARPDFIPKVVALIFGAYMTLSGFLNLKNAFALKRSGYGSWAATAVIGAIILLAGLALLGNPLMLANTAAKVLGIALLVSGVMNILGTAGSTRALKKTTGKEEFIDI